ncbi:SGNH/GDSL hydrolase family protein [Saccharospirillum sp.]|uniref:SGNH/GDSL hydrolase family protein n=1 Tax=Saccharospirillum sp. TaxID=2033801 RepID=UPI0034A08F4E
MENTVLCFGDSNTWGASPGMSRRYSAKERWPMIVAELLGPQFRVIEEGLPGRTTVHDDPFDGPVKNGIKYLEPCLISHQPDLVILLLGTNDLKSRFNLSAFDISMGANACARLCQGFVLHEQNRCPEVLLVSPPRIYEVSEHSLSFSGGTGKSAWLSEEYSARAEELGCHFFDAGTVVESSTEEGIHWDVTQHTNLANSLAPVVQRILERS